MKYFIIYSEKEKYVHSILCSGWFKWGRKSECDKLEIQIKFYMDTETHVYIVMILICVYIFVLHEH